MDLELLNHGLPLCKDQRDFGKKHILHDIITACVIMYNMIIEDKRDLNAPIEESG